MARPPLQAAREYATKKLIAKEQASFNAFMDEYLAEKGWSQQSETVTRWRQQA